MSENGKKDLKEYREFISGIEIGSLRLVSVNSKFIDEALVPAKGGEIRVKDTSRYEVNEKGFIAIHTYIIETVMEGQDKPYIIFKAVYEVKYLSEKKITKQIWNKFRQHNLPLNTWPYARELFHNTVLRFNHPPIILPAFKT